MSGRTIVPGTFDGVHLGHLFLLEKAKEIACGAVTVLTFHPHPLIFLGEKREDFLLTTPKEKEEFLKYAGVEEIITLPFDSKLREMTAEHFFREILIEMLSAKKIIVGEDFRFGRGREGDVEELLNLGELYDVEVFICPPFKINGEEVKSERIRNLLKMGEVKRAKEMLGRFYSLRGMVVKGKGLGRKIGYPTANLEVAREKLLPAKGIYAVKGKVRGEIHDAICYIGDSPTVSEGGKLSVEVHIFGMERELAGEELEVFFIERIREERKFPSLKELVEQIGEDIREAQRILASY
ncbi:bifunctional riboflavin kinase/FAD synthetase [bacterium]|nr:bifunctional riboflavin kinase/FAD synthetase [bacterium]